jgi:hypothetical protein
MEHDVDTDLMVRLLLGTKTNFDLMVILYQHWLISITKRLSFCLIFDDLELDTDTNLALHTDGYT